MSPISCYLSCVLRRLFGFFLCDLSSFSSNVRNVTFSFFRSPFHSNVRFCGGEVAQHQLTACFDTRANSLNGMGFSIGLHLTLCVSQHVSTYLECSPYCVDFFFFLFSIPFFLPSSNHSCNLTTGGYDVCLASLSFFRSLIFPPFKIHLMKCRCFSLSPSSFLLLSQSVALESIFL